MDRVQLTQHFWLHEFARSQEAARRGMPVQIGADSAIAANLKRLCVDVLEPLRGKTSSITITSGYRPLWLNRLVGSADNSQHVQGLAADFVIANLSPLETCLLIQKLELPFDQLIHEFGEWVHVSVAPTGEKPRGMAMTAVHELGKVAYRRGILPMEEAAG